MFGRGLFAYYHCVLDGSPQRFTSFFLSLLVIFIIFNLIFSHSRSAPLPPSLPSLSLYLLVLERLSLSLSHTHKHTLTISFREGEA